MQKISDEILKNAARGDMAAVEEIYKTFSSTVYTVALGVTQNRQDAEEVTQDVFIKALRGLKNFKFESLFGTWLYKITMNTALNYYGKRLRSKEVPTDYNVMEADLADNRDAPKDKAEKQDAAWRVSELLKKINPEQRSCIILREIEGLDYKEIADVLAIPLNTVRSRIKRARESLIACCRKGEIQNEV